MRWADRALPGWIAYALKNVHNLAARLRAVTHPFILRRTKDEVAEDLPPKIESDKIISLAGDQKALYLQVLREVRAQVMGERWNVPLGQEPTAHPRRPYQTAASRV